MKLFDRLIERLADEIADRLLAAAPVPIHVDTQNIFTDDRYTDAERALLLKRAQK